jgi:hypothetical protein
MISRYANRRTITLRVPVYPRFGEMDDKPLRIFTGLESIRQAADAMRVSLAVAFPGDFSSWSPRLCALV